MSERLPPGQRVTERWPVLHAGSVPADRTIGDWSLTLHGEVDNSRTLSFVELLSLAQQDVLCDIHCVTSWSKLGMHWRGVSFRTLEAIVRPKPTARFVVMESEQGFTTSLPIEALREEDVIIAHTVEEQALALDHGGPVRMLVPQRYFYKSAKWLRGLKFTLHDEPGFWEVRGYSNVADPWMQTRYDVDDVKVIHRMRKENLFQPVRTVPGSDGR